MSKFVFTPELTKADAQLIIEALKFQAQHKKYASRIDECVEKLMTKELTLRLRKLAKIRRCSTGEVSDI